MTSDSVVAFLQKRPILSILCLTTLAGSLAVAAALPFVSHSIKQSNPARLNEALKNSNTLRMYWQIKTANVTEDEFTDYASKTHSSSRPRAGTMYASILDFGNAVTGLLETGTDRASAWQSLKLIVGQFSIRPYAQDHFDVMPPAALAKLSPGPMQDLYGRTEFNLNPAECEVAQPFFAAGRDNEFMDAVLEQIEKDLKIDGAANPRFHKDVMPALRNFQSHLKAQCAFEEIVIHHGVGSNQATGRYAEILNDNVDTTRALFLMTAKILAKRGIRPTDIAFRDPVSNGFRAQP